MIRDTASIDNGPRLSAQLSEHYRALAERIRHMAGRDGERVRAVGITSSSRGEGVSSVAANFAHTVARMYDQPVLLVDGNLHRPMVHRIFNTSVDPGFADVLVGSYEPPDAFRESSEPGLSLLTAGSAVACTRAAFDQESLHDLVGVLKQKFDLIVFDLPPATETSPCYSLASVLDGVLMVVEAERIHGERAHQTKRRLELAQATPLGVIFNKRPDHMPGWLRKRM